MYWKKLDSSSAEIGCHPGQGIADQRGAFLDSLGWKVACELKDPGVVNKMSRATPPRWSLFRALFITSLFAALFTFFRLPTFTPQRSVLTYQAHQLATMRLNTALSTALLLPLSAAQNATGPDADGKYVVTGTNIRATFIPYGASISNLFINDTSGVERDIIGGWDNATYYGIDKQHPHFGGVPVSGPLFEYDRHLELEEVQWSCGVLNRPSLGYEGQIHDSCGNNAN